MKTLNANTPFSRGAESAERALKRLWAALRR